MSREVRRVPVGWKHPTRPDTYGWTARQPARSHILEPGLTFVALNGDYPEAVDYWLDELRQVALRTGNSWKFHVEYHLTGYQGHDDKTAVVHPFYTWTEDGETEVPIDVRDEDHLFDLLIQQAVGERPKPDDYMPVFEGDDLGWCLYETVSEGTPTTPVFATAEELIHHLATVGEDYDQTPYRREAAEQLVSSGHSLGTFVIAGGTLFHGARDIDRIPGGKS